MYDRPSGTDFHFRTRLAKTSSNATRSLTERKTHTPYYPLHAHPPWKAYLPRCAVLGCVLFYSHTLFFCTPYSGATVQSSFLSQKRRPGLIHLPQSSFFTPLFSLYNHSSSFIRLPFPAWWLIHTTLFSSSRFLLFLGPVFSFVIKSLRSSSFTSRLPKLIPFPLFYF